METGWGMGNGKVRERREGMTRNGECGMGNEYGWLVVGGWWLVVGRRVRSCSFHVKNRHKQTRTHPHSTFCRFARAMRLPANFRVVPMSSSKASSRQFTSSR